MTKTASASIPTVPARGLRPSITRIVQVVLVAISSTAALVSVLNFAKENLGAAGGKPVAFLAGRSVAWVRTSPEADTAAAIGDTLRFAATVADRNGSTLNAAPVLWTTSDATVATVDDHGQVVARAAGTATITVTAGAHAAQSRVVVRQAVAAVTIATGDTLLRLGEDQSRGLTVRASDRRGWVVAGRRAAWRSADSTVATVDSNGVVVARAAGRTLLTASVEGAAFELPVAVHALPGTIEADSAVPHAPAGRTLARRVAVRVRSTRGQPARDVTVRFAAADDGKVEPMTARTSADGVAYVAWTLGGQPGRQRMGVSVDGLDTTVTIVAEAEPVAANTRYVTVSTELTGRVGEPLPRPVQVRLVDSAGRALADVPVTWSAEQGGSVTGMEARTDSLGHARAAWTLGRTTGRQRLVVQAGRASVVPPHVVLATATAGPPSRVALVSGGAQAARAGSPLAKPVRLRVADAAGNPVAGARVMVLAASGSTADSVVATDSSGIATVRWTLGRVAGAQQLLARPEGVEPALTVTAEARPRPAADLSFTLSADSATVGSTVKVRLLVRDEYGNPVPDVRLALAPGAGNVTPRVAVSDRDGVVAATWTLGRAPGEQLLATRIAGTSVATTVAVVALAPAKAAAKPAAKPAVRAKPARRGR